MHLRSDSPGKLIYLDLTLDRVWDENRTLDLVFPVRGIHHENIMHAMLELGVYLAEPGDTVAVRNSWDSGFTAFFEKRFGFLPAFLHFENEDALVKAAAGFKNFVFAGKGPCEEKIHPGGLGAAWYAAHNAKSLLVSWAAELGIAFPETRVVTTADLKAAVKDATESGPLAIKADFGSGGRGVFKITDPADAFLNHLGRVAATLPPAKWLVQSWLKREMDFYTVCDSSRGPGSEILGQWQIDYDAQNNSWRHRGRRDLLTPEHSASVRRAAAGLASKLRAQGYHGPFGMDGFIAEGGEVFPSIDLNVRFDKSRVLIEALARAGLDPQDCEVQRLKTATAYRGDFAAWWKAVGTKLGLDADGKSGEDYYMLPLSVGGLFSANAPAFESKRPVEILLAGPNDAVWSERVREAVLGTL